MTQLLKTAVNALEDKKANNIQVMQVTDLTILADYFILASGTSNTQVKALADEVEFQLSQQGISPHHIEGKATGWIVLDYGIVVIHVFYGETREFYDLERLWSDAKQIDLEEIKK